MGIPNRALCKRAADLLRDYGVTDYVAYVGPVAAGNWAHCNFAEKELVFSEGLLETDWVFANQIILHEVAHAVAGKAAGHSRKWKKAAKALGYRLGASVPYSDPADRGHKWVARCLTGAHSAIRYEQEYEDGEMICGKCLSSGAGEVPVLWERLYGA